MNKPVLFRVTNNLRIGGVQRRLRALLPLLTEEYEVHIVTYKDKGIFFDELAKLGIHTHFMYRTGKWNPIAIWKLAQLFRKHNASIVHTHSFGGNIFGILAAALARVPVRIGQTHLSELHWYSANIWRRKKQIFEEKIVHFLFSHRILFVSRESRDYFQKHTHLPDTMLTILHNGLQLPDSTSKTAPSQLGLPEGKIVVGFVGRIAKGKGMREYLEIARQASLEKPGRFHFAVVGDGDGLKKHIAWVKKHNLTDAVSFLGEQRDIHRYYGAMDCFLFCSGPGIEGMPGVVLEACAHGLPILARETEPIKEIKEYYSRIVFLNETESAASQLEKAISLPDADRSPLLSEFSVEAMKNRTLAVYKDLTAQAKK